MIMMGRGKLRHDQQKTEFRNFHGKFDLNITAPEQEQQPCVQWEFLDNHYSQYSELPRSMEKQKYNHSAEAHQHGEQVPQSNTLGGCVDHLLILAQSAEILAQSEDGKAGMHSNNQDKGSHNYLVQNISKENDSNITADDKECSQKLLDRLPVISHVSSQRSGVYDKDTRPRLTQIRKQARYKNIILDEERDEDNQCKHLQGKTIRLCQIKDQARCRSKNDLLLEEMITGPRNEQPQGRILRLSQMKHQARSKGNATGKEGTEEHMDGSLHWNRFKDSNLSMVEGVPAHNVFRGASQSYVVGWDEENLREHQRTARRLRAFKTKKLRQRLKTKCIRNSANMRLHAKSMSPIMLMKDKDLIASQPELPETSGHNEELRANFSAKKLQGHVGCNVSSGFRYEPYQHISNVLPGQSNVLPFTRLPNNVLQQYGTNMGWMLYMHPMQLMEYHRVVARQRRADHIDEKRTLKDKLQNPKDPVHENSHTQKGIMPVRRLRLTHLRREARLGNQGSVIQGHTEN